MILLSRNNLMCPRYRKGSPKNAIAGDDQKSAHGTGCRKVDRGGNHGSLKEASTVKEDTHQNDCCGYRTGHARRGQGPGTGETAEARTARHAQGCCAASVASEGWC